MLQLLRLLDAFSTHLGKSIRWLSLVMVILTCAIVFMRYALALPSIVLQETTLYLHAALFMLGTAYTWQCGGHVRVDIFHRNMTESTKRLVERLGILLLLVPFCVFLLWVSWRYVGNSWAIGERSSETGGLPFVYLLKSLIIALPILLLLQSIAEFIRTFVPTSDPSNLDAPKTETEVQHG